MKPGGRAAIDGRLYGPALADPADTGRALRGGARRHHVRAAAERRDARARPAWFIGTTAVVVLVMTHTRTALIALIVGLACAMITPAHQSAAGAPDAGRPDRRARPRRHGVRAAGLEAGSTAGESAQQVGGLNGRTQVWHDLIHEPRSRFNEIFGIGLTNKSFNGLSIDNSWLATYQDQGLFGVVICAAVLISLLMLAATRPRGPCLAVAIFLIVYCMVASWTEVGLGDVSPYVLDLAVAASLLAVPGDAIVAAFATIQALKSPAGPQPVPLVVARWRGPRRRPGGRGARRARARRRALRAPQRRHRRLVDGAPRDRSRPGRLEQRRRAARSGDDRAFPSRRRARAQHVPVAERVGAVRVPRREGSRGRDPAQLPARVRDRRPLPRRAGVPRVRRPARRSPAVRHGCYRSPVATVPVAVATTVHARAWRTMPSAFVFISASQRDILAPLDFPPERVFVKANLVPSSLVDARAARPAAGTPTRQRRRTSRTPGASHPAKGIRC